MNKHIGSTLDSLFEETGELWEVRLRAQKKIFADQLSARMKELHVTKVELAKRMKTSRSHVDTCLDPEDIGITFSTVAKALDALGLGFSFTIEEAKDKSTMRLKAASPKQRRVSRAS